MKRVGLPLALAAFAILWFWPLAGVDERTRQTLALMAFTIILWITRPWMPALTGLLFMALAWLLGLASSSVAFSGFSRSTPWFVWAALVLALSVRETQLDLRIAYTLLKKIPASSHGLIGLHYLFSWLLGYLIPSTTARVAALAPIAASQLRSLGLGQKSNAAKMLMISLVFVNWMAGQALITGGTTPLTAWGILQERGIYVSWIQWWGYQIIPLFTAMIVLFIGCSLLFRPESNSLAAASEEVSEKPATATELSGQVLAELGPLSSGEKKIAALTLTVLLLWATEPLHGISSDRIGILAGIFVLLPRVGVLEAQEAFKKIGWHTVVFVAAALSIGDVTDRTGVAEWLGGALERILNIGQSQLVFLLLLLLVGALGRLFLRSGAASAVVILVPTLQLAQELGYNPRLVGVLFPLCMASTFIYQNAYALIAYDYGSFEEPDFILASLVRTLALAAAILVGYFFWWPLFGLV